jgi:hypothetical protein
MQYVDIWALRKEARESWDHTLSDKVIYLSESSHGDLELSHVLAKKYLDGDFWFEIHWTFVERGYGEMHFNCICEVAQVSLPALKREVEVKRVGIARNRPVFVHAPELIKLPEGVTTKSVSSQVRLKRINLVCHCGWEESPLDFVRGISDFGNGKLNLPLLSLGQGSNAESPRQLIEGGTETANEVSQQHGDEFWRNFVLDPNDVDGLLEIVIVDDGIRLRVNPILDGHFKLIEVKLRPAGFHIYVNQPRVNRQGATSLTECGTIGA